MNQNRNATYDNLKFIMIFLVVLGHFADLFINQAEIARSTYFAIYMYHMPVFIFVSGLFSKKAIKHRDYKKAFGYVAMYLFFEFMRSVIYFLFFKKFLTLELFNTSHMPWFILAIGIFYMMTMCLQNVDKWYLFLFFIVLACFIGYDNTVKDFMALSRVIVFYPFFWAGYCFDVETISRYTSKLWVRILGGIMIVGSTIFVFWQGDAIYWLRPLLTARNSFEKLGDYASMGGLFRLIYYMVVFLFIFAWIAVTPTKKTILTKWGSNSLMVYLLHYVVICIISKYIKTNDAIMAILAQLDYLVVLIPMALVTTVFFSLDCWKKILNPILKPKWNRSESGE